MQRFDAECQLVVSDGHLQRHYGLLSLSVQPRRGSADRSGGAAEPNSVVGDIEGNMVAYCTKSGHGTRLIPPGAISGVQAVSTPGYFQIACVVSALLSTS